jgi:hypothetical protein
MDKEREFHHINNRIKMNYGNGIHYSCVLNKNIKGFYEKLFSNFLE